MPISVDFTTGQITITDDDSGVVVGRFAGNKVSFASFVKASKQNFTLVAPFSDPNYKIVVVFNDNDHAPLSFYLENVSNQAAWINNETGAERAVQDIMDYAAVLP